MKPPIIANNKGDVLIFKTIEAAENYIEPIDVKNGEYEIYDSEGQPLDGLIYQKKLYEKVKLTQKNKLPVQTERLYDILLKFLNTVSKNDLNSRSYSLEALIEIAEKFNTE